MDEAPTGPGKACFGEGIRARVLRSPPTAIDRRGIGQQSVLHPPEQVACPIQRPVTTVWVDTMTSVRCITTCLKGAGKRIFRSGGNRLAFQPLPHRD